MNTEDYKQTPLAELKDRLSEAKYDPLLLVRSQIETIEEITNGEVLLMDPTHPFVMQLEMSACMAANTMQENIGLLRRVYPVLAEASEDLYMHMSDTDYINRFATASTTKLTFSVLLSDIQTKLVYDSAEKSYKGVIPRDTRVMVDGILFVLPYPVVIRRYETGAIQITYDSSITTPLMPLKGQVLTPTIRRSPKLDEWLFFDVEVIQVSYTSTVFVLERTYNFRKQIYFTDAFFLGRAFYRNAQTNNAWKEIKTTHTDQVFDPTTPTVIFKVMEGFVQVEIPVLYFISGILSGDLRIDLYTTKGALTMDLLNYKETDFEVDMTPIDEVRDSTVYSNIWGDLSYYVFGQQATEGGKRELSLEQLRNRVIYNAIGPQSLPITNVQNVASAENYGFEILKNIDVLTNRSFLASRKLPKPSNPKLITAANIGMIVCADLLANFIANENVIVHDRRYTIRSNSLFQNVNGKVRMLRKYEEDAILAMGTTAMVNHINNHEYFYTPFYYVLDETEPEFDLRAYTLDLPVAGNLSFERQNQTLQLFVNTARYSLTKTHTGYRLSIQTNSGNYYKEASDNLVGVQLAFTPYNESTLAYINGKLVGKTEEGERVYEFLIETDHELDKRNLLRLTNAEVQGITDYQAWIPLDTDVYLIHYTGDLTQAYAPDETDQILGKFLLNGTMVGNSLEKLHLHLGDTLDNLWRRNHSYSLNTQYKYHAVDIPLLYEEDTYDLDPVTRLPFKMENDVLVWNTLHRVGEPVLDTDGNVVMKYQAGDPILDEEGLPIQVSEVMTGRELDILIVDARYYFSTDKATVSYRDEITRTLTSWITGDIQSIRENLLEQTNIFFYPKTTLGDIKIFIENNEQAYISAEQRFTVVLYVKKAIYDDEAIRRRLENATTSLLDSYISQNLVNMTEIRRSLEALYGDSVTAFKITGLGGLADYEIVSMASEKNKLCLRKDLVIQSDMVLFVRDAVDFDFRLTS